jgi:hypothetical protein
MEIPVLVEVGTLILSSPWSSLATQDNTTRAVPFMQMQYLTRLAVPGLPLQHHVALQVWVPGLDLLGGGLVFHLVLCTCFRCLHRAWHGLQCSVRGCERRS